MDEIKKLISLNRPHLIEKLSREELAGWVQTLFFNDEMQDENPERKAINHILKKEIAFQAIQVILNGAEPEHVTIKNEKDWIRYFQLENQNP